MRPSEHSPNYLHGLDGWRAFAVLAVLFDHMPDLHLHHGLGYLQHGGGPAVRLFFAISGLLICTRLMDEEATYGRISLRNFYVRRVFRILPASLLYLFALALLGAIHCIPWDGPGWIAALAFFRNYWSYFHGGTAANWFTGHFWSLSVEEHFYFLLPSILVFFPKTRRWVLAALIAVSIGWAALYLYRCGTNAINPFWNQRTEFCLVALLVPALIAISMRDPHTKARVTRWTPVWLGLLCGLGTLTPFIHPFPRLEYNELLTAILKAFLLPVLLLSTMLHPRSIVTRLLELAPMRFVGRISYSLYLWQTLFLSRDFRYNGFAIAHVQSPLIGTVCSFACAIASYYLVETPLIQLGRRFAKRRHPMPVQEQAPHIARIPGNQSA